MKRSGQCFRKQTDKCGRLTERYRKSLDRSRRPTGKLGNRFGELAEHLVAPNIAEKFNDTVKIDIPEGFTPKTW